MTYSIITPADNADFFAQFKTFVVGAGWTIDAQSDSELYIHSGTKYLGFRLGTIGYKFPASSTMYTSIFFTCTLNSAYDNTQDYLNQPGSSVFTLNSSYLPWDNTKENSKYLSCIYCPGDITNAVFIADADNIIVKIKRGAYAHDCIIATWINKSHNYAGGGIIASSSYLLNTLSSFSGWFFNGVSRQFRASSFFSCGLNKGQVGQEGMLFSVDNIFYTPISVNNYILTNITSTDSTAQTIASVPFSETSLLRGYSSSYTGLYALIKPQFFYRNGLNFCYAGNIEKIKIVDKTGFIDQQILNYGNKQYIILAVNDGDIYSINTQPSAISQKIAVEL